MKKCFAILIMFSILFSLFSACGGNTDKPDDIDNEAAEVDLFGANFVLGSIDIHEFEYEEMTTGPGDKMNQRYAEAEEKFNITIGFHQTPTLAEAKDVTELIAGGFKVPDFYDMKSTSLYDLYKLGLLQDYSALSNLDINSTRWGTKAFLQQVSYAGGVYGVWPYDWETPVPQMGNIMLMNNAMLIDFNQISPYELFEQQKWVWDTFTEMLQAVTVNDADTKVHGLTSLTLDILANTAIYSNGGEKVKNINGNYSFGYTDTKAVKAIDYVKSLIDLGVIPKNGGSGEDFSKNRSVFFCADSWVGTADAFELIPWLPLYNLDNFGWIPFPYGPDGEYGSYNALSYHNQRFFAMIPVDNDEEDVAMVMNFIFAPLENSEAEGWKNYAERNMFYDEKGFPIFVKLIENIKCDYSSVLGSEIVGKINAQLNSILNGRAATSEGINSIESIINTNVIFNLNN